jgi:hypothetical protein
LVDEQMKQFARVGPGLYERVRPQMQRQAYASWETMMRESLVRACVVRWRYANQGPAAGMAEITEQWSRGFLWTAALSRALADYEAAREKYPTLESFMPRVAECFESYAKEHGMTPMR